ncbi:hypothetical protein [Emticicia aquatica]|nr:hypothetical protein [Emticicia aquatica]
MKMLLPIVWFVLNVLSFNTFPSHFEQKILSVEKPQNIRLNQVPSENSHKNKPQIYFLPEEIEENVEEDADHESELDFLGNVDFLENSFFIAKYFTKFQQFDFLFSDFCPIAYHQAKFIRFRNIRI